MHKRKANSNEKKRILDWLKLDIANCLYMYMDIVNYGLDSGILDVFVFEANNSYVAIAMRYHDSFQFFWNQEHLLQEIKERVLLGFSECVEEYRAIMASGRKEIIEGLEKNLPNYKASYGIIHKIDRYREMPDDVEIIRADVRYTLGIAELICSDREIGGHYTKESLSQQLSERIQTKTGRSYIIVDNGRVVAHTATYVETDKYAVISGTIIEESYRSKDYYIYLSNYILKKLFEEGKVVYTFSLNEKIKRYHDIVHKRCGEYGKLELIK